VTLILGPSAVPPPIGVTTLNVETAAQLQWALANAAKGADAIVMTAAVADYRPAQEAKEKLKRGQLGPKTAISLVANPDLLAELGKNRKGKTPLLVGFAAETENVIENARGKLASKKIDLIVANDVSEPNSGFAVDTNHVQLVDTSGAVVDVPPAPKSEVAHRIIDRIAALLATPAATATAPRKQPRSAAKPKRR
jgi:phosphopantothenoylcysteine decarboxylase/phosphopantothenate--cysteine ligase